MEPLDFNKDLMDYLYGEMDSNRKREFEAQMEKEPELKAEYESLASVREDLTNLSDKEVMEPFSTWARSKSNNWFNPGTKRQLIFRPVTAVAASLVLLMVFGYLTRFSLSINDRGVHLAFGEIQETEPYMTAEQVKQLVADEVDKSNKALYTQLTAEKNQYDEKFSVFEASLNRVESSAQKPTISDKDLEELLNRTEDKHTDMIREYLALTTAQQQKYFKETLTQFNNYYRQTREADLEFIQNTLYEAPQQKY